MIKDFSTKSLRYSGCLKFLALTSSRQSFYYNCYRYYSSVSQLVNCFFYSIIKKLFTKFLVSDAVLSHCSLLISIILLFCSDSRENLKVVQNLQRMQGIFQKFSAAVDIDQKGHFFYENRHFLRKRPQKISPLHDFKRG